MFKGFQTKSKQFNSFPALNFQMNNEAYGFVGCTFWLNAAYGINTQVNLSAVSTWKTIVGEYSFTQNTAANQPRLVLNDISFNNLPVIDFYSDQRRMYSDSLFGLNLDQTICWIAKVDSENTINYVAGIRDLTGANKGFTQSGNAGSLPQSPGAVITNGDFYGVSGTYRVTNTLIVVMTSSNIIINGINRTTTGQAKWNDFSLSAIGGSRALANPDAGLIGKIAEFLVYNNKLSQSDCITLSNRINSKYAIY